MDNNDLKNFNFLQSIISPKDVLVDVGANYGDYTDFFRKQLDGNGKIYSIELHPETFTRLKNKFEEFENIKVLNFAVCNNTGEVEYFAGKDAWTNNIIGHDMSFNKNASLGKIQSIRLDELLENEKKIKLIKIDVEGAEKLVLQGMKNIIHKVENILVECHLDEEWEQIRNIILYEYNFDCTNIISGESITNNSKRPYQCFCKKKFII